MREQLIKIVAQSPGSLPSEQLAALTFNKLVEHAVQLLTIDYPHSVFGPGEDPIHVDQMLINLAATAGTSY